MDAVFKALADASRRRLLDRLNERNGLSLRELCAGLEMTRQAVTKHLAVLVAANLVTTVRHGRQRLHYLNPAPINDITDRWIGRYDRERLNALADLKRALEDKSMAAPTTGPVVKPEFVYVTYIQTTPEQLWQALIDGAFTSRYFAGLRFETDWQVGSPLVTVDRDGRRYDAGEVVLEFEPPRRLSYSFKVPPPDEGDTSERAAHLAAMAGERPSRVVFELEPAGSSVKLTVTHDDFEPASLVFESASQGWPAILSGLKTLLETGNELPWPQAQPVSA